MIGFGAQMAESKNNDSSRILLDEIEGEWDAPKPGGSTTERKLHAELDAAADDLDAGWDDKDEEDEEPEEVEPELPDERLDPVAYAVAKKAREERIEARLQRKRAKAEAKKARRKARAEAARSKQKGKSKKSRPPPVARPTKKERRAGTAAKGAARTDEEDSVDADGDDEVEHDDDASTAPSRMRKLPPSRPMSSSKPMLSKTNTWMLGIAIVVFVAAAIFAAVVTR